MTQITAKILKDSINLTGKRITTFELIYPRWIHAELLTHCQLARNAASSRAVPVNKQANMIIDDPAMPVMWGANEPGMQSHKELKGFKLAAAKLAWKSIARINARFSKLLSYLGMHKQYANRVAEYAQVYKVVLTATDFDNFFYLRRHEDAQPEIKELANRMYAALNESVPELLLEGMWHLPYVETWQVGSIQYYSTKDGKILSLQEAQRISASCCAQVSYRRLDDSLEKAMNIFDRLIESKPMHASALEHLATPMPADVSFETTGVTHMLKDGTYSSGKFNQWVQYRHLLPNNTCNSYEKEKFNY